MSHPGEILTLWIGPEAQKHAHNFYSLQAEQFFNEECDPTLHRSIWVEKDKDYLDKIPNTLIFDSHIPRLSQIRRVNHAKMIRKMKQNPNSIGNAFGNSLFKIECKEDEEEQAAEAAQMKKQAHLFENWTSVQSSYVLIDRNLNTEVQSSQFWEGMYEHNKDEYENAIRRKLETQDFLRMFFLSSDDSRVGFTTRLLQYLRDSCPKKDIIYNNIGYSQETLKNSFLPNIAEVSPLVDTYTEIGEPSQFAYFDQQIYQEYSPLINCLLTPFILKQSSTSHFVQGIVSGGRNIFNAAYTLPVISTELKLHEATNIFQYMPNYKSAKEPMESQLKNRVNFTNNTYLRSKDVANPPKGTEVYYDPHKLLAQSYVLKGNVSDFQKRFRPRTQMLSVKYLEGILVNHSSNNLKYNDFYVSEYGQEVVGNYPFHTVSFQHECFGVGLRSYVNKKKYLPNENTEMSQEWRQQVLSIADRYCEVAGEDSD